MLAGADGDLDVLAAGGEELPEAGDGSWQTVPEGPGLGLGQRAFDCFFHERYVHATDLECAYEMESVALIFCNVFLKV